MKNNPNTLIHSTGVYYTHGPYGPIQHTAYINKYLSLNTLRKKNGAERFTLEYANTVTIDTDTDTIIQCGGYHPTKGMFTEI